MSVIAREVSVAIHGTTIVDSVSLTAHPGEVTGLIGPNGAGKSTVLAALSGGVALSSGAVECAGLDVAAASPAELARVRSVMLQDVSVAFGFLVRDVVAMGRAPWGRSSRDAELIDASLAAAGIEHLQDRQVTTLSGGERARVALARVLAQQTPVVFLDEPTAALDVRYQEATMGTARVLADRGRTVVVVLHDLSLAAAYCDRVACLKGGRLVAAGRVDEVYTPETLSRVYDWDLSITPSPIRLHVTPQLSHGRLPADSPLFTVLPPRHPRSC
ncbi:heme ABC transporter ATP-binding protein [Corynebacterium timonense]|uniref:Iron complex transport system ATP-binding protein n=1 Tax=Corynebacterium timonense TaxID=441500 RepID=A0A1H1QXV0_9CORY|nr:heme ABC transporter ATP-binding protein [Corynebacterium timonense]SDS27679.1 iron complex transport system ATP-binding protein [Corynebacterium timonense]